MLKELPNLRAFNNILTHKQSIDQISAFLTFKDPEIKSACFQFMIGLLTKLFRESQPEQEPGIGLFISDVMKANINSDYEDEDYEVSKDFYECLRKIVVEVLPGAL